MADTFTPLDRYDIQPDGSNANTWGDVVNAVLALIEQNSDGVAFVAVTAGGTFTLSVGNGVTDQARMKTCCLTGSPVASTTLITPSSTWLRNFVNLSTQAALIKSTTSSTTTVTLAGSSATLIWCDGSGNLAEAAGQITNFRSSNVAITGGTIDGVTINGGTF